MRVRRAALLLFPVLAGFMACTDNVPTRISPRPPQTVSFDESGSYPDSETYVNSGGSLNGGLWGTIYVEFGDKNIRFHAVAHFWGTWINDVSVSASASI